MILLAIFFKSKEIVLNQRTRIFLFLFSSFIIFILHSGLRHWSVGLDTFQYNNIFENVKIDSIDSIWENVINGKGIDPFYDLFQKIFQYFSNDYQIYLIFVAILFFGSYCFFLYDNLISINQILISNIIYIAYFSGFYSVTGIRQTIATSFLLYAFAFFKKQKNTFVFLFIFLASLFHITSFIFILIYLTKIKWTEILHLISIICFFIIFNFRYILTPIFTLLFLSEDRFGVYTEKYDEGGSLKLTILNLLFSLILLLFNKKLKIINNNTIKLSSNAFAISIFFLPLQWVNPSAGRIGMYFSIFLLIILPYLLDTLKFKEDKNLSYFLLTIIFIFLTIFSSLETRYLFFWQTY
jgi:hypothetical protein